MNGNDNFFMKVLSEALVDVLSMCENNTKDSMQLQCAVTPAWHGTT